MLQVVKRAALAGCAFPVMQNKCISKGMRSDFNLFSRQEEIFQIENLKYKY